MYVDSYYNMSEEEIIEQERRYQEELQLYSYSKEDMEEDSKPEKDLEYLEYEEDCYYDYREPPQEPESSMEDENKRIIENKELNHQIGDSFRQNQKITTYFK